MAASQDTLHNFKPRHQFFIGIDSDGCAFDTMEIKHKECFGPRIIEYWDLQAVSKYARQAFEFVNLYSRWRGINRWPALKMVLELLRERPEVQKRGVKIPEGKALDAFIAASKDQSAGIALSNEGMEKFIARTSDEAMLKELRRALAWSQAVNKTIEEMVHGVPPFPFIRESMEKLASVADIIVVSATPTEALVREWAEHRIDRYAAIIAGQEMGSKRDHLALAARGKYPPEHILMIGDAPGDLEAARSIKALFFPVNPGTEDASWELFYHEGSGRFLAGSYAGSYENRLIAEFERLLPATPPWKG